MIKSDVIFKERFYKMPFKFKNSFNLIILLQLCFLDFFIPRNIIASQKLQKPDIEYLRKSPINGFYILGPGDTLKLSVTESSELLDQEFLIDINGQASLLRLKKVYVEGLTITELTELLNEAYSDYVKEPNVNLEIIEYKPVNLFIEGEVANPGNYSLPNNDSNILKSDAQTTDLPIKRRLPTLIEAIKESGGLTENADLKNVVVLRNNNLSNGGGKIKTTINLFSALDGSAPGNNITVFDGDKIIIPFTNEPMISQIKKVMLNDLNPEFINVYVTGAVEEPGLLQISNAAVLTEAIALAGDTKVLKGPVRFLRYQSDGNIDKRKFKFKRDAKRGSYKNPYLRNGDVITVGKNSFNIAGDVINDITSPLRGLVTTYGFYKIFED